MAENEYRRLGCIAKDCGGTHKAHGYCLRHYRQWQRGGIKTDATACAHCSAPFEPSKAGAIYCSSQCKLNAWRAANPERWAELNERKVSAVYAGYCETCDSAYVGRAKRKYCTPACVPEYKRTPASPVALGVYYTPPVRTCPCCKAQWSAIRRIGSSQYCWSPECQEANRREIRRHRTGNTHIARAKKHGAAYGYFNVMRVFERDKWRCRLCGVATPKRLRGTQDPRAPEIDHILPLSAGGAHLIENCQCSCRQCNNIKSARPAGQMWLAGFADTR